MRKREEKRDIWGKSYISPMLHGFCNSDPKIRKKLERYEEKTIKTKKKKKRKRNPSPRYANPLYIKRKFPKNSKTCVFFTQR